MRSREAEFSMSIFPLPVFEADADPQNRSAMTDDEIYARLEPPKTIVVRYGVMKMVGEFRYEGDAKPGCGSKLVARTPRGTELVEMLTTTCENAGCSKSVTRKELLEYVENSGGKDFPFHTNGRVIRVATIEDLNAHAALRSRQSEMVRVCRRFCDDLGMTDMKVVEAEAILGGEVLTFYYMSEARIDFRELVRLLASEFQTRIEMRQVGARDEARLIADYERCGQYCCCKNFLKVLKPISMTAAKMQKATLDPLKISGRCGRLMCCLRYEDQTYRELKARLPHRRKRVGTSEGPGIVVDSKILVQLVLVRLEHDDREVAVPVEELMDPETCPRPGERAAEIEIDPLRGMAQEQVEARMAKPPSGDASDDTPPARRSRRRRRGGQKEGASARAATPETGDRPDASQPREDAGKGPGSAGEGGGKRRRRRRRSGGSKADGAAGSGGHASETGRRRPSGGTSGGGEESSRGGSGEGGARKKSRRRRRRGGGKPDGGGDSGS